MLLSKSKGSLGAVVSLNTYATNSIFYISSASYRLVTAPYTATRWCRHPPPFNIFHQLLNVVELIEKKNVKHVFNEKIWCFVPFEGTNLKEVYLQGVFLLPQKIINNNLPRIFFKDFKKTGSIFLMIFRFS